MIQIFRHFNCLSHKFQTEWQIHVHMYVAICKYKETVVCEVFGAEALG